MSVIDHSVPFERYHGTGNDFLVVDGEQPVPDRAAFAAAHCDRETGVTAGTTTRVGADGVLFLATTEWARPPRVVMTLVQPDGSIAEMCGNGARVAAAWAADRLDSNVFMIDTPAGTRRAELVAPRDGDGGDGEHPQVVVEMGWPRFDPESVPLAGDEELVECEVEGLTVTAVNTGVPHAVTFVDDVEDVDLDAVGPAVRSADVFPEGANVTLAAPDGDGGYSQRTYERGVEDETRSCGTGAVAIVAAAARLGRLDDPGEAVRVSPPGGDLHVTVSDRGPALLRGPVEREFAGEVPASPE